MRIYRNNSMDSEVAHIWIEENSGKVIAESYWDNAGFRLDDSELVSDDRWWIDAFNADIMIGAREIDPDTVESPPELENAVGKAEAEWIRSVLDDSLKGA